MTRLGQTPSQTLGPFFHQGLLRVRHMFQLPGLCTDEVDLIGNVLTGPDIPGERLRIEGTVYDGAGKPVPDALIEIWQADARGTYQVGGRAAGSSSAPWGFGRAPTDASGHFFFETIKPGRIARDSGAAQAPHLNVIVGARGMARHAFTRIYFAGDAALADDPVLACVPHERRSTLIAEPLGAIRGILTYRFDIRLQGERETVFFDL